MKFILASASDRRRDLLKRIIPEFQVIVSDFNEEHIIFQGKCEEYVMNIAKGKALNVASKLNFDQESIIIACDTIVSLNGKVLGKPKDEQEALLMLRALSGSVHEVFSGLVLIHTTSKKIMADYVCTKVKFSNLSHEDINKYINTKEYVDKAGAYAIQGYGGVFVEGIEGCYYNVVGLPLNKLNRMLREMGVNL